ncbi:PQQ-dependent sugar dehydrogenase [Chitinivorax sp. PXF-14]|uniref:PQQ-dependent sugar dehydrogenase n=1 Tax=Chitinivorax sp. PXF-14 TaxID=3230488 RepID=UPI003466AAF1
MSIPIRLLPMSSLLALLAACGGGGGDDGNPPPALPTLALRQIASGLVNPLFLTAPANDARLFIVEQPGRVRIVKGGALLATPFLDISASIASGGERGLLSLAFDPRYAANGYFYVYFTDPQGNLAIQRYSVSAANADQADPASALRILSIAHPDFGNHNGGLLAFGPDGQLYAGTGDGGGAGDPSGNGQNLAVLLGKLLRLDVSQASAAQPYAIPADNPFANQAGKRGEIWAYGLRNPWRYAFDGGTLYIADVGQDQHEEVDVVSAAQGGLNFGWNLTEGNSCYAGSGCNQAGLTLPVLDYDHSQGCSITGGYVYRGAALPALQGRYFYSDYCGGWLRSFSYKNGLPTDPVSWPVDKIGPVLSFGQDAQKELYLLSSDGGKVYRIEAR